MATTAHILANPSANTADPVLLHEDRNAFNKLLQRHKSEWAPVTAHEEFLVHEMAGAQWKLERLVRIENAMFAALEDPAQAFTDKETAAGFARLERYRASVDRTYHRCARELRASRKRQNEANSQELAEKKYEKLLERMMQAPPPGYDFEPRLVPTGESNGS